MFSDSLVKGDIVILSSSEHSVKQSFENLSYGGTRLVWDDKMVEMLGKRFRVLDILGRNIIALPSPDGSQDGKWYFNARVVAKVTGKYLSLIHISEPTRPY